MALNPVPPPDDWLDQAGPSPINKAARNYLVSLSTRAYQSAALLRTPTSATAQSASISATPIPLGTLAAGWFRVSWFVRVTTAATTSSSLIVTIGSTDSGVSTTQSGAAMTGNTTGTSQGLAVLVHSDQAAPLTYATTYASVGATPMAYKIDVLCEQVG